MGRSWPSFFVFVTPFAAVLCAIGEARDMKAGLGALIISALVGLILGIGGAICTVGFARRVSFQEAQRAGRLVSVVHVLACFLAPIIATTVTCAVVVWFISVVL